MVLQQVGGVGGLGWGGLGEDLVAGLGEILLGVASVGHSIIKVDGREVLNGTTEAVGDDLGAAFLAPPSQSASVQVTAGTPIDVVIEHTIGKSALGGALSYTFGIEPDKSNPEKLLADAVEAAATADVAIVVVGTNSKVESEGYDRESLDLPGLQDELVRRVVAANPRTVVVVNSGSPVLMPWREDVAAPLLTWFGGQEYGHALADVITGIVEPGGRLPTTWPATMADVPVLDVTPVHGKLACDEDIHIGYRAWLQAGAVPAYPFGYGLGYTSWSLSDLVVSDMVNVGGTVTVSVDVTNEGPRAGEYVVQVYASRAESEVDRPALWLVGFAPIIVPAGEHTTVEISVPARAFADWRDGAWPYEAGEVTLRVGSSVANIPLAPTVLLEGQGTGTTCSDPRAPQVLRAGASPT